MSHEILNFLKEMKINSFVRIVLCIHLLIKFDPLQMQKIKNRQNILHDDATIAKLC